MPDRKPASREHSLRRSSISPTSKGSCDGGVHRRIRAAAGKHRPFRGASGNWNVCRDQFFRAGILRSDPLLLGRGRQADVSEIAMHFGPTSTVAGQSPGWSSRAPAGRCLSAAHAGDASATTGSVSAETAGDRRLPAVASFSDRVTCQRTAVESLQTPCHEMACGKVLFTAVISTKRGPPSQPPAGRADAVRSVSDARNLPRVTPPVVNPERAAGCSERYRLISGRATHASCRCATAGGDRHGRNARLERRTASSTFVRQRCGGKRRPGVTWGCRVRHKWIAQTRRRQTHDAASREPPRPKRIWSRLGTGSSLPASRRCDKIPEYHTDPR
jgi:hypothetical protein